MLQGGEHGDRSIKHRLEMMDQMKKKRGNQKTSILIVDDPILPDGQAVNPLSPTTRAFLASRIERSGCSPSRARRMQQQMGMADGGDDGDGNGGGGGAEVVKSIERTS